MTVGQRIRKLRKERGLTQEELATILGYKHKTSISKIESDERNLTQPIIKALAEVFDISPSALLGVGEDDEETGRKVVDLSNYGVRPISTATYPVLGEIACGVPKFANEQRGLYVQTGAAVKADFCLIANGDSMINARINDGDIVFIRSQEQVDNGEIAAVIIGEEATLKRVYYYPKRNLLILKAENPKYEDLVYTDEQLDSIEIKGKAVAFQSHVV